MQQEQANQTLKNFIVLRCITKKKVVTEMPTVITSFHSRNLAEDFIKKIRRRNLTVISKGVLKQKYPAIFYQYYPII